METATVHIQNISSRGTPVLATPSPSPPESCVSNIGSSEHLSEPKNPKEPFLGVPMNMNNTGSSSSSLPQTTSITMTAATTTASTTASTNTTTTAETTPQHLGNHNHHHHHHENAPKYHQPLDPHAQDDIVTPPTVTTTVSSSCTTAFPSLPPYNKVSDSSDGGGDGDTGEHGARTGKGAGGGAGGSQPLRNKRPTRDRVLRKLSDALMRRSLTKIDLSQRDLRPTDATLIKLALLQNSSLSVLKLGYNNLCDEGVATLASGICTHNALTSLDLGFNNIGDEGCRALSSSILSTSRRGSKLHTLYLAGNSIGEEGARALAQVVRIGCGLKRIHLTRNSIGPDGIKELMEAVIDYEAKIIQKRGNISPSMKSSNPNSPKSNGKIFSGDEGVTELFLGGTNMGHNGCIAVAKMLEHSTSLRVLSLENCDLHDREAIILATAITKNCKRLPIEKLQLSFNNLTCKGIEALMNAVWGLKCIKNLQLDNNQMQTRGAQVVSAVLGAVSTLTTLNVGFNSITGSGIKVLMKNVAKSTTLTSLTISGNTIDSGSANAVAIALANNKSLTSLFLDHCSIPSEGQRLMTAGIVSNSNTRLQILTGFRIGSYAKILRLPEALEHWANEQALSFILLMWKHMRQEKEGSSSDDNAIDPLNLLPHANGHNKPNLAPATKPIDAQTVVAVAKRAFEALGPHREEILSQRSARSKLLSFESPLAGDVIVVEANGVTVPLDHPDSSDCDYDNSDNNTCLQPAIPGELIFRKTITKSTPLDQSTRKKKIVKWLCNNMYHLNELSNLPFNDGELWRLHQHFVSPTIQEINLHCNGESSCTTESIDELNSSNSSAHPCSSILSVPCVPPQSVELSTTTPASEPVMGNLSMLKRKVSYRFLHDAAMISNPLRPDLAVSKLIEDMNGHSMQPKSKRARRNRSRISIVPRIKKKLDSYLVSDHHRALGLMRQLAYVEKSLLNGSIYPVEDLGSATHLFDSLASDAEMILVDMM